MLKALRQADYLSPKYHVVVANPPYMGGKGMTTRLKDFADRNFPDSKSDLYSMFAERCYSFTNELSYFGLMTPFTWMFLGSQKGLRRQFIEEKTVICLVRPEYHAFFDSAYVPICAFCIRNSPTENYRTSFIDLNDFYGVDLQPIKTLEAIRDPSVNWAFSRSCRDFTSIPGSPFAFTVDDSVIAAFADHDSVSEHGDTRKGMATGLNEEFVRAWSEVSLSRIGFGLGRSEAQESQLKWFPYANGGQFRKWYGNYEDVVNWYDDGARLQTEKHESGRVRAVNLNLEYIFNEGISWTSISSSSLSVRTLPKGFLFSSAANAFFGQRDNLKPILGLLNSELMSLFSGALNPTLNANPGDIGRIPVASEMLNVSGDYTQLVDEIIEYAKRDWDNFETSWDFNQSPFLPTKGDTLAAEYENLRAGWNEAVSSLTDLECELNARLKNAYDIETGTSLKDSVSDITLTCNPVYRYDDDKSESELEALLLADTMREFISYAVGCMLGRYSLDKPGLILANQGETLAEYLAQVPEPSIMPDDDNVIPLLDGDWFTDDISERFKEFLKVTFGSEHYAENLKFLEDALYPENTSGRKRKTIRDYFLKEFYNHHIKLYKKRPIYWLFSSPKGTFNALIYMHRCHMDFVHTEAEHDYFDNDPWTPFLRITNSYNKTKLLQFDLGFCRGICRNGLIFGKESIVFKRSHSRSTDKKLRMQFVLKRGTFKKLESEFRSSLETLHANPFPRGFMWPLICKVFDIKRPDDNTSAKSLERFKQRRAEVEKLTERYFEELGDTGYAALNVLTDYATRPPVEISPDSRVNHLQVASGIWMEDFSRRIQKPDFSFVDYLGSYLELAS